MDPARYRFAVRRGRLVPRPAVPVRERLARAFAAARVRPGGALIACGTFLRDGEPRLPSPAELRGRLRRYSAESAFRLAVPEFCIGLAFGALLGFLFGRVGAAASRPAPVPAAKAPRAPPKPARRPLKPPRPTQNPAPR